MRQVDDLDFYVILARWKLAVVIEQGFQRADTNTTLQAFGEVALNLMHLAADLAETTDYRVTRSQQRFRPIQRVNKAAKG